PGQRGIFAGRDLAGEAERVDREGGDALAQLRTEDFGDRGLVVRYHLAALHPADAVGEDAADLVLDFEIGQAVAYQRHVPQRLIARAARRRLLTVGDHVLEQQQAADDAMDAGALEVQRSRGDVPAAV